MTLRTSRYSMIVWTSSPPWKLIGSTETGFHPTAWSSARARRILADLMSFEVPGAGGFSPRQKAAFRLNGLSTDHEISVTF